MAELSKNYKKIVSEIEEKIKDPKELEFIKGKISELTIMIMDTIDNLVESNEKGKKLERKIDIIQNSLEKIEQDIYIQDDEDEEDDCECEFCGDHMHDNDYEFEILCPYCDYEFITGKETDLKKEIECPNCHNLIELDWEESCSGECNECKNHCYTEDTQKELKVSENQDNEYKYTEGDLDDNDKEENKKEDNEDDM